MPMLQEYILNLTAEVTAAMLFRSRLLCNASVVEYQGCDRAVLMLHGCCVKIWLLSQVRG